MCSNGKQCVINIMNKQSCVLVVKQINTAVINPELQCSAKYIRLSRVKFTKNANV